MRIRYITERLESEGWELYEYGMKVTATKGGETVMAISWNKLYFKIHKPKEKPV